jgi:predicted secreted protein
MIARPWRSAALLAGAFALVAACRGQEPTPPQQQAPVFKPIDPATMPTPEPGAPIAVPPASVALGSQPAAMVTDLASGWPIALRVGQQMTARLTSERSAGARWSLRAGSDGGVVRPDGEPAYEASAQGGAEVFRLTAVKAGSTTLTFDYKKGADPAALRSVSYPVTVQ